MKQFADQTLSNQTIVLDDKKRNSLGPGLVLENCHLAIEVNAKAIAIAGATFTGCRIEVRSALKDFQSWCRARLIGCQFIGTYVGNDFGFWPEGFGDSGSIENCDFSKATLDGCRIVGSAIDTMSFPSWPCFTILEPAKRLPELNRLSWPGKLNFWVEGFSYFPEKTRSATFLASAVAKGFGATDDELLETLQNLDGVIR